MFKDMLTARRCPLLRLGSLHLLRGSARLGLASLVASALVFTACDLVGDDEEGDQQQEQVEQVEQQAEAPATAPAASASPPAAQEATEPPPPEAEGGGAGANAYSIVFPSLAFVMTSEPQVATGLVTNDGYVLVEEGALDGGMSADVLLSNGDLQEDVAIVGHDQFTGLVWLGPLDSNLVRRLPGARLGDGEAVRPGSSVFAVGYAADDSAGALPVVYSGVLSGFDEWTPGQRTFLHTDARPPAPTGGMILVDSGGTVIGFASSTMVAMGWYVSTGDLARSLPPESAAVARAPDPMSASTEHTLSIGAGHPSGELYLGDDLTGQSVSLSISADAPALLQLIDADGEVLQESTLISGATIISLSPSTSGPYRLVIWPQVASAEDAVGVADSSAEPASYQIVSSLPLLGSAEADALLSLQVNTPLVGGIDVPGDADSFDLAVRADAVYEVTVQSLLIDSLLLVEGGGLDAIDDDAGGGPFGIDSMLTLEPTEDAIVSLTVKDFSDLSTGPYVLTVTQISGDPPVEEEAVAADTSEASEAEAVLPAPRGNASMRGEIIDNQLVPTLIGVGSELGEDNSLIVLDADGIFEIVASIVGADQGTARLLVFDANDEIVVSGRVILNCAGAAPCLASAVYIMPRIEPGPPGIWRVVLQAEDADSGITDWQIDVFTVDRGAGE